MWDYPLTVIIFLLCSGIVIRITTKTWLYIWMGMEINSYAFVGLTKNNEFRFKYFLIQTLGSILFLYRILISRMELFIISMMLKINAAPFFLWVYPIIKWIENNSLLLFLTIQKITPLCLLYQCTSTLSNSIFNVFVIINSIIGLIGVITKKIFKDVIFFSSIYQIRWIIIAIIESKTLFKVYFFSYIIISYILISLDLNKILYKKLNNNLILFWFLFILIRGFPPSLLFIIKIIIIEFTSSYIFNIIIIVNIIAVVGFVLNYLKIIYSLVNKKMFYYSFYSVKNIFNIVIFLILSFFIIL